MVQVRARSEGRVLLITVTKADGGSFQCALDEKEIPKARCARIGPEKDNMVGYEFTMLSKNGNQVELGVRTDVRAPETSFSTGDIAKTPQATYLFEPGETLKLNVAGVGTTHVTGEWTDHVPVFPGEHHDLDPGPNELRVISPLLLKGKQVVADREGDSTSASSGQGIYIYSSTIGRYLISLSPMQGAVQAHVVLNRISFQWDGDDYVFVTGAPVTRSNQQVWVLYEKDYKSDGIGVFGVGDLKDIAPEAVIPDTSAKN